MCNNRTNISTDLQGIKRHTHKCYECNSLDLWVQLLSLRERDSFEMVKKINNLCIECSFCLFYPLHADNCTLRLIIAKENCEYIKWCVVCVYNPAGHEFLIFHIVAMACPNKYSHHLFVFFLFLWSFIFFFSKTSTWQAKRPTNIKL